MIKNAFFSITFFFVCFRCFAQHQDENANLRQLSIYQDSLKSLGNTVVNNDNDLERKNANYEFIKTLVTALKVPNSFAYPFDSVKTVSIQNAPDKRFRIITWHVVNQDGSYRFYGTIQMNTGGPLQMYPLEDYSPLLKNPEDSVVSPREWYGAQYYHIIKVEAAKPYYVLIGWKGNTVQSNKKVIDVLSFTNGKPQLGMPVFDGNGKTRRRIIFEYARQTSMLLRYVPEQNLIVFDNLSPPDPKLKNSHETYGPDLSYDGYKLKNGRWMYIDNLDMRNIGNEHDAEYTDPKKQAAIDKATAAPPNQ